MNQKKIQVMIIDDSPLVRQVIAQALVRETGMEVMSTSADPLFAMDKLRRSWPDVIILDIEMTRMNGLSFLRKLMAERPTPVIICSAPAATVWESVNTDDTSVSFVQISVAGTFVCGMQYMPTALSVVSVTLRMSVIDDLVGGGQVRSFLDIGGNESPPSEAGKVE